MKSDENNMASLGGEDLLNTRTNSADNESTTKQDDIRKPKEREDRLRIVKDRQNEERQRKLEELKNQAIAAQKYREQKEDERKRRMEELRHKELDRKQQVDERKKAIMDAERERREYILRKNQERDMRLETKKRHERGSIAFAFGSSTPRLLEPLDSGTVSPSQYWGHRRSTSISNVTFSGAPLSRRSSERELSDGPKKRATSAGGLDRQVDGQQQQMSTSMYGIFNWGQTNNSRLETRPKRFSLALAGSEINIDDPPNDGDRKMCKKDDSTDSSPLSYRSVHRRKTDLMPTVPSPRDPSFGSKSSLYHTPRTPGRAVSMTRLDQLAQPTRRNGEHIRAVIERQRQSESNSMTNSVTSITFSQSNKNNTHSMSRSLTHLAGNNNSTTGGAKRASSRPLRKTNTSNSMSQLHVIKSHPTRNAKFDKTQQMNDAGANVSAAGSRSGDATPGSASRPGSAMSTSTTASGVIYRRSVNSARKPRPASIASTGMTASCIADISVESDVSKHKKDRPPLPKVLSTPRRSTAATPPSSSSMTASSSTSTTARSTDTSKRNEKRIPPSSKKASTPRATTPVQSSKPLEVAANVTTESVPIVQTTEIPTKKIQNEAISIIGSDTSTAQPVVVAQITEQTIESEMVPAMDQLTLETTNNDLSAANSQERVNTNEILLPQQQENEMTASMMKRIVTEEEAKAALAERRRLAREEAEKLAELERQRKEAEELAEQQRIAEEEENQRRLEEETLRLVEEQKKAEELRLLQAIEEAKLKEEEERKRKELEEHARIEREELERKAREEAEKLKIETAEKLRKEEKEREERRKRVEAIMSRTRKGGNATNTPNKDGSNNADQTSPSNSDLVKTGTDEHNFTNQNNVNMATYEMSVTNKENALMNSFSNLIEHQPPHPTLNIQEFNAQNAKTNGKSEVDATNDDNLIIKSAISNGNGHTDHSLDNELDSKKFSAVDNKTQEMITGQLIDINMDFNESSTPVNFNNNSLLTSTNLVTSDSPESKDLSLL
ncbi:ensconsin isoform X3 [Bradysia coprophila]|uniref:ensconsin isoform X3 n=1 Tax=Bradysia coprophila TaxID=38358 RepID=UPI00187D804B|nr:ensconsin isoform X3 [Bradysia coprophila]